jgi:hypothetical protein
MPEGPTSTGFEQQIEVPAERWVVVDYWYPDETESGHFTIAVHDQPVSFE